MTMTASLISLLRTALENEREVWSGFRVAFTDCLGIPQRNANQNHFIKVNLQGVQSNLRGIGARVSVTSTNGFSYRQNTGGGGGDYASQGSQPLHFGIGSAAVGTVVVTWPSGVVDTLPLCRRSSSITVIEGSSRSGSGLPSGRPQSLAERFGGRDGARPSEDYVTVLLPQTA
jgi:hypothetical protein